MELDLFKLLCCGLGFGGLMFFIGFAVGYDDRSNFNRAMLNLLLREKE